MVNFFPGGKVRPKLSPWQVTIANLDQTPPTVSTRDASKDVPGLPGSLRGGAGSISVTLDGRSDDASKWIASTWSGGASHPVRGSEAGLGLSDSAGGKKLDGGEAIVWAFDVSAVKLAAGESLILTSVDFGGEADGEKAEFWRRVDGKGTRFATGGQWEGNIAIAHGDEFALADNGRLRSLTLRVGSTAALPAAASTATSAASVRVSGSAPNIIMILADDMAWYDTPVRLDDRLKDSAQEIMRSLKDPGNPSQPYK